MLFFSKKIVYFSSLNTCLKSFHKQHNAKMIQFANYNLPANYALGALKEHLLCREHVTMFDVGHMGQITISGEDYLKVLERATVGSTESKPNQYQGKFHNKLTECYLTLFLNEKAGIIDDAIASIDYQNEKVRVVANGSNKHKVKEHLNNIISEQSYSAQIKLHHEKELIALQGPKSQMILAKIFPEIDFDKIPFMSQFQASLNGHKYRISRCGYTGQDGFEISSEGQGIIMLAELFMQSGVSLAGLAARNSLRLEAGLCLHGNDIDQNTTPLQANLKWTVHKNNLTRKPYIGKQAMENQIQNVRAGHVIKKRVGFVVEKVGVVREHCQVLNEQNQCVGYTTSGTHSPSLKKSIGMAYIESSALKGSLKVVQRGKQIPILVTKMPFIKSKYFKGWKSIHAK